MAVKRTLLALLLASLFMISIASPIDTSKNVELETRSEQKESNETISAEELEYWNHLEARDDTVVNCNGLVVLWAEVKGFRTFIDNIPDTQYSLGTLKRIMFYTKFNNQAMVAMLYRTYGTVASGANIRKMLHTGFSDCVLSGKNIIKSDSNVFTNYIVSNPGYKINLGGGLFGCHGLNGEGPGECKEVYVKAPA